MSPVIRVDDGVMEALKAEAVRRGMVFGTPNDVLKELLGVAESHATDVGPLTPRTNDLARSGSLRLDTLIANFIRGFEQRAGESLNLQLAPNGKWVSRPDNFVTLKPQPRKLNLAFTVYGKVEDFSTLGAGVRLMKDRTEYYSRFTVADDRGVEDAIRIALHARDMSRSRKRRRTT